MTLLPSKNVKPYIVITINKNKYFITSEQELALRRMSNNDKVFTDQGMFKVHQIAEILPIEEYYKINPEEKPVREKNYTGLIDVMRGFPEKRRQGALNSIIRGFKKHFRGRKISPQSQAILDCFIKRLTGKVEMQYVRNRPYNPGIEKISDPIERKQVREQTWN